MSRLAGIGQRPSECVAIGFPDAEAMPAGLRKSEQVPGRLLPGGAARDPGGLVPFDVSISVPADAPLWEGFSGSAVVDEQARLVGLVVKAHPRRQQRRLLIVPIEDAASDPDFAAAAAAVGLDPTVEDRLAALWRQSVEPRALTAAGIPPVVADVTDLRVFGIHSPSADTVQRSDFEYLQRDKDSVLDTALAETRSGGPRVVLIVGDSAAGKSRSACEAVRRHPELRCWRLVVPLSDGGLRHLADAETSWQDTVLWLDDLDKYLARGLDLGTLRRVLGNDPAVVAIATMRTIQLQARQSELADPAWEFLTDDASVSRIGLEASLSNEELTAALAIISDVTLLNALQDGVGLGEWLVAGPELMKKLSDSRGLDRAVADTVIAWSRTGLDQPLPESDARRLWAEMIPPALRHRLLSRGPGEQDELFDQASAWACRPVISRDLYEQALVTKSPGGYVAHDYVVDHTARDSQRQPVPDSIWRYAVQYSAASPEPDQKAKCLQAVANAAFSERAFSIALAAFDEMLASFGDSPEADLREQVAIAQFNAGVTLDRLDRPHDAFRAYAAVVARFGRAPETALRERVADAMVGMAVVLDRLGQPEEAIATYDGVVAIFGDAPEAALREVTAASLVNKGLILDRLTRPEEAIATYDRVVAIFGDAPEAAPREQVAKALLNKGLAIGRLGRSEAAIEAFNQVVSHFGAALDVTLREKVALALLSKGIALHRLGRAEDAGEAFDQVVTRFGGAPEPALARLVVLAPQMKSEIEHGRGFLFPGENGSPPGQDG